MLLLDIMEYYTTEIAQNDQLHMSISATLLLSAAGVALVFASLPLFLGSKD